MNALLAYVNESDLRLSGRVRTWGLPRWVRFWMRWATRLADGSLWLLLAAVLALGGTPYHRVLAAGAVSAAVTNTLLVVLKRRFRRCRPCVTAPHPLFADVKPPDPFSFPSGHSMNAFAACTVVALGFPPAAPMLGLVAASIAASRVLMGMHYLSDVVVGSALGALVGGITFLLLLG